MVLTRRFLVGGWFTVAAFAQQPQQAVAFDPAIAREVREVLDRAYASRSQPDLSARYRALASDDAAARKDAGAFLHALLVTNFGDALNGYLTARSVESFRGLVWLGNAWEGMAETLAATRWSDRGEAVEAVAVWLLRNTSEVDDRVHAMRTIVRIETAGADALIREVVRSGHPTFRVLALGMRAAAARGMKDLVPAITSWRGHYHPEVSRPCSGRCRTAGPQAGRSHGRHGPTAGPARPAYARGRGPEVAEQRRS
jgi:hypothetical protein